jgi:hypothetical protein
MNCVKCEVSGSTWSLAVVKYSNYILHRDGEGPGEPNVFRPILAIGRFLTRFQVSSEIILVFLSHHRIIT